MPFASLIAEMSAVNVLPTRATPMISGAPLASELAAVIATETVLLEAQPRLLVVLQANSAPLGVESGRQTRGRRRGRSVGARSLGRSAVELDAQRRS